MTGVHTDQDTEDKTVPPRRTVRFDSPLDLFRQIPEIQQFTHARPAAGETHYACLHRLRESETAEDALVLAAFAAEIRDAIAWAHKAMRTVLPESSQQDQHLLRWIEQWLTMPSDENRWRTMSVALFANERTPAVYLGLAVGWSGGAIAPNDPTQAPPWRAAHAVETALLTAVSRGAVEHRDAYLARVLDLANGLFRVH